MEQRHDYAISLIRCVSMGAIILCHIMQYLDCVLAWWFNVGVQIFLCMSGYLYGDKTINGISFIKRAFSKILVSYYLVLVPFGLLHLLVSKWITLTQFFKALIFEFTIPGGGHLWFVPTILCCYLFTPLLFDFYAGGGYSVFVG